MISTQLTVLAGPTAVGKGTVVRELLEQYPQVWLSVSATTRAPRPGEVDGMHYWFVTPEKFLQMQSDGELLEWAQVHGKNYYGTPRQPVLAHLAAGTPTILEIDLSWGTASKTHDAGSVICFLEPPSFTELERRLIGRGTESEEERARRLETARVELAAAPEFDAVIVNDTVSNATQALASLMGISVG